MGGFGGFMGGGPFGPMGSDEDDEEDPVVTPEPSPAAPAGTVAPGKIIYEAEIVGHEPPFEWKVFRTGGPSPTRTVMSALTGKAETFQEAVFAAQEAVTGVEYRRAHAATKETIVILEVEDGPVERRSDFEDD